MVAMATKYLFSAFGGSVRCSSVHLSKNGMKFASANEYYENCHFRGYLYSIDCRRFTIYDFTLLLMKIR